MWDKGAPSPEADNVGPSVAKAKPHRKRAGGNYFAVDQALANRALDLSLEAFLALLVLARGAGGDQRSTKWGVNSIEQREILGRPAARRGIGQLEAKAIISTPEKGVRKIADRTVVRCDAEGKSTFAPRLWLPNQLIDGPPGHRSPLIALRETRSVDAARLLMHIYALCDLEQWGGVPPSLLRGNLKLEALGDRGMHTIYGIKWAEPKRVAEMVLAEPFMPERPTELDPKRECLVDQGWSRLSKALDILDDLKLVERAAYIFDGPPGHGEPIAPCVWGREGEETYSEAMNDAARRMMTRALRGAKRQGDALKGFDCFAAIPKHVAQPHGLVLTRPRLLPDTELTRRWLARLEKWRERAAVWEKT